MTIADRPLRAVLNFTHRCALECEWCYVPFGAEAPSKQLVVSLVQRIADLRFTSLTIGGGDPFQYRFLPDVLRLARPLALFLHIDTHAKGLTQSDQNLEMIRNHVDLLGLPVDGASPEVHDAMRASPGHFNLIVSRMNWLQSLRDRLKVNTFVSARNVHHLTAISKLVSAYEPARWSIYQYWPLGPASKVAPAHMLPDDQFLAAAETASRLVDSCSTAVEVNLREPKRNTYPIINHSGEVFVQTLSPENEFISLGSLFDDDVLARICASCVPERRNAETRYASASC